MSVFNVQPRGENSLKPAQLRRKGLVPMALVERTHHTLPIQAPVTDLRAAMRNADGLGRLDIQIEGEKKPRKAIVKHVDLDGLKHQLLHVTLQEVTEDDQVKMDIPVVPIGEPSAIEDSGAILMQATDHIKVRGKMSDLPERIEVDVANLNLGEHIDAGQIVLPNGIELLSSPDATLFSLRTPQLVSLEPETVSEEAAAGEGATEESATEGA